MKKYFIYFSFFLTIFFFFLLLPIFFELNLLLVDKLHGNIQPSNDIVIVNIDDKSLNQIGPWPWNRTVFANFLKTISYQQPQIVAFDIFFADPRQGDQQLENLIKQSRFPIILANKIENDRLINNIFYQISKNGFANLQLDFDGKVRQFQLSDTNNNLSFVGAIYSQLQNYSQKSKYFNYTKYKFNQISFSEILDDPTKINLNNKIVLVGVSVTDIKNGITDNLTNIFGQEIPGIEVHANILNSIIQNRLQRFIPFKIFYPPLIIVTFGFFYLFVSLKDNWKNLGLFIFIFIIFNLVGITLFDKGINWYFVQTNLFLFFTYISSIFLKFIFERKENRFIKQAFSQYLNPKLLNQLLKHPDTLKLGGDKKDMTVMFSDIRSFTTISEKLSPQKLISVINDYLNQMSEIVLKNNGTIDKYIGDAIMAFWNAPITDQDHRQNAIITAIEINEELIKFRQNFPDYPPFNIGIGINSGNMVVGNIGGRSRFDYTVLGDNVNLASRLEGLTKKYLVTILASQSTVENLKLKNIIFRQIDEVVVKGRTAPIKIYQPLIKSKINVKLKNSYETAFKEYQKGNFSKAKKIFKSLQSDPPSQVFVDRINSLTKSPNWQGIWHWEEK